MPRKDFSDAASHTISRYQSRRGGGSEEGHRKQIRWLPSSKFYLSMQTGRASALPVFVLRYVLPIDALYLKDKGTTDTAAGCVHRILRPCGAPFAVSIRASSLSLGSA